MEDRVEILYLYSLEDEALQSDIEDHLVPLERQGIILSWGKSKISSGKDSAKEFASHIESAHIILLLVSSSYLSIRYGYGKEMARVLERYEAGETRVIPIILRPVDWSGTPFSHLKPLPIDGRPVTGSEWHSPDEAMTNIAQEIRKVVFDIRAQNGNSHQVGETSEVAREQNEVLRKQEVIHRSAPYQSRRYMPLFIPGLCLVIVIVVILALFLFSLRPGTVDTYTPPTFNDGIGAYHSPRSKYKDELIGLSDGTVAFDIQRAGGSLVTQGVAQLKMDHGTEAGDLWQQALDNDPNDAEAMIYLEDQRVLASHNPYITLVIGTILNGSDAAVGVGRDNLQGAYIAQKNANDQLSLGKNMKVRLLIANAGSSTDNANFVAQQIVYAFSIFKSRRVALFIGNDDHHHEDPYSRSLAKAFSAQYRADGGQIVVTEKYTVESADPHLPAMLTDALKHRPDLIYFAGNASDVSLILPHFPTRGLFANIQVMGGDGLDEMNGYINTRDSIQRLHFTAFASPDEWSYQQRPNPTFFDEYAQNFSTPQHQGYGYSVADNDAILSFDALNTLLIASHNLISRGQTTFTGNDLQQALSQIDTMHSIQGVSGVIAFGPDGNSIDKAVVVLSIDSGEHVRLNEIDGDFLP